MSHRVAGAAGALLSFVVLGVAPASASTLTKSGDLLVFTAAADRANALKLEEPNPWQVRLTTTDDPVATLPSGCQDTDGNVAPPHNVVTCSTVARVEADLGDLNDSPDASGLGPNITTLLQLGPGSDQAIGGDGADEIHGQDGRDVIGGGPGADKLYGGADGDILGGLCKANPGCSGPDGADLIDGGDGSDELAGHAGDDVIEGGPGDDTFDTLWPYEPGPWQQTRRDPGDDTFRGGPGIDRVRYLATGQELMPFPDTVPIDVRVTLDGVADDGQSGEADNIASDVEDVRVEALGEPAGTATVVGSAAQNSIVTAAGPDSITPGDGTDFVDAGDGDDTVEAVDGFADRISCGAGTDTANVDEFDTVSLCEAVNVTNLGRRATEDAPPAVAWVSPAADGAELESGPTTLVASAADDVGVTKVVFLAGSRVLCTDTAPPFECVFSPIDADVGKATLAAVAYDGLGQTATALRFVDVDRFRPMALGLKVRPKRDRRLPFRFRAAGELELPAGVSVGEGCRGRVQVRFKVGKKTISARKARVRGDCSYRRKLKLTQRYRLRAKRLRVFATFLGNDVLKRKKAARQKVRIG